MKKREISALQKNRISFLEKHKKAIILLLLFFMLYFMWSIIIPYDRAPDENSRYKLVEYLFSNSRLPVGDIPKLSTCNTYGVSYAFRPYTPMIVSALFMKIASFLGIGASGLIYVARLVSVITGTLTVAFLILISKELNFKYKYLLPCIMGLIPQFAFISAYVNMDSYATLSTAVIIYAWIKGIKTRWDRYSTGMLALGITICLGSYYNAYPYLIISAAIFLISHIKYYKEKKSKKILTSLLVKSIIIIAIALVFAGWYFVFNYVNYGEFLGTAATEKIMNKYSSYICRPDVRRANTYYGRGYSLLYMLMADYWVRLTLLSLIGMFDYMSLVCPDAIYVFYIGFLMIGFFGKMRKTYIEPKIKALDIAYIFAMLGVTALSLLYSYTEDYQPQGRYLYPAMVPFMIFIVEGLHHYLEGFGKKCRYEKYVVWLLLIFVAVINLYCLIGVVGAKY